MILEELLNHFYESTSSISAVIQGISPIDSGLSLKIQVETEEGPRSYQLNFREVYGFRIEHFNINEVEVTEDHPILLFANQAEAHLNYASLPSDPLKLDYVVRQLHREYFENWVDESEVLLQDLPKIDSAPGVLAQGPIAFVEELKIRVQDLIESHVVLHNEEQRPQDYKAFFLDDNWVIYRELDIESLDAQA